MNKVEHIKNIDKCEKSFLDLFAKHYRFSKNLIKYYDDIVFDMHDHNYFEHNNSTTIKEIEDAYNYQKSIKRDYLKLMSDYKLNKRIVDKFGLDTTVILTMLYDTNKDRFKINDKVKIKPITLTDLNKIELKHFGDSYGRAFILRRNKQMIQQTKINKNFVCCGAYLDGKIVGSCYSYTHGKYTCIDLVLTDDKYRHQYIASTLLKYIIDRNNYVYLHAELDDTPKDMYKKLGFKVVKKQYEYFTKVNLKKD